MPYRIIQQEVEDYTVFKQNGAFSRTDQMLVHKTYFSQFKKIKFNEFVVLLQWSKIINNKRKFEKLTNMQKLNKTPQTFN